MPTSGTGPPHAAQPRPTGYLNAFRGAAALWVLTVHCMIWGGWRGSILDAKMAVDLFMILSGFLMALTLSERQHCESIHSARTWIEFYIRRFFRIAPAYYAVLVIVTVLAGPFLSGYETLRELDPARWLGDTTYDPRAIHYDFANLAMHASFLFGLHPGFANSTQLPDWSLGLEMQFYAVFPAIFLLVRRYPTAAVCMALTLASYLLTLAVHRLMAAAHLPRFPEPSLLIFKLPVFLIGVLIHDALHAPPAKRWPFLGAMALASLQFYRYGYWSLLMLAFEAGLYVLWTRSVPQWLTDVLDNRFSRFMSDTSYSVYLLHGPFLAIAGSRIATYLHDRHAPPEQIVAAIFAAVAVATYASAYVFFRCIERPGIRLGRVAQNAIVKARPAA